MLTLLSPHKLCLYLALTALALEASSLEASSKAPEPPCSRTDVLCLDSLDSISITTLRQRSYSSYPKLIKQLGSPKTPNDYTRHYSQDGSPPYSTFVASYHSDGLLNYARVDIPATVMPVEGFPVVLFAHGWVGKENAPDYGFGYDTQSFTGKIVDAYVDAGFVVVTPGHRGHGTIDNQPAAGIEFMQRWDNSSYLMPSFYAIDLLNLLEGLDHLNNNDWVQWGHAAPKTPKLNLSAINLSAHSQGGDVALTALAISGEGSSINNTIKSASIWSGNIPDRFTQAETFGPMASSLQAFMSGDGKWTGSAVGQDGSINPNFIFAWPADWIGTLDTQSKDWSWQQETWNIPTVEAAVRKQYNTMYATLNHFVRDIENANFNLSVDPQGKIQIKHPMKIAQQMRAIGGFFATEFLTEPLSLHFSDRDYYSFPVWNTNLTKRINLKGGEATAFIYPGNTHSLKLSKHRWFSPIGTHEGFSSALKRDLLLFSGEDPKRIKHP